CRYWLLVPRPSYWLLVTGYWLLVTGYWLRIRQHRQIRYRRLDPIDRQAGVLIGDFEHATQTIAEFRQPLGRGVHLLQLADDYVLHTVFAQHPHSLVCVAPGVKLLDVAGPLVHVRAAEVAPLLLLMPVPAQHGRQPGVDREPALPGVQVRAPFDD